MTTAKVRRHLACVCMMALLVPCGARAEDKPIASAMHSDGKVRVDIRSMKRSEGDTVTLRITVANNGNSDFSVVLANMRLVDLINRRSYAPGLYSASCGTPPGKETACWAMFAAPPVNTKTISLQFYERFDLVTGIPVSD